MSVSEIGSLIRRNELFACVKDGQVTVRSHVQGYICGKIVNSKDRLQAYDSATQLAYTNEVIAPLKTDKHIYSQYMPFFFSLMSPFALLPLAPSFIVWTLTNWLVASAGLLSLLKRNDRYLTVAKISFLIACAATLPSIMNDFFGSVTPLILGTLCFYWLNYLKGKDLAAGIFLALSSLKPHYTVFAALPCLAQKRWKVVLAAFITELLLFGLGVISVGWDNVIGYPKLLLQADSSSAYLGVFPETMICLRGPLSAFFPQNITMKICLVLMLIAMALLTVLWYRTKATNKNQSNWAMALTSVIMLIVSPHTHIYDQIMLALPAALTLYAISKSDNTWTTNKIGYLWRLLLITYPIMSWISYLATLPWHNACMQSTLGFNIILACLAFHQWQEASKTETRDEETLKA
jgi:hypothetical protein